LRAEVLILLGVTNWKYKHLLKKIESTRVAGGGMTPESEMKEISLRYYDGLVRMQKEDEERTEEVK